MLCNKCYWFLLLFRLTFFLHLLSGHSLWLYTQLGGPPPHGLYCKRFFWFLSWTARHPAVTFPERLLCSCASFSFFFFKDHSLLWYQPGVDIAALLVTMLVWLCFIDFNIKIIKTISTPPWLLLPLFMCGLSLWYILFLLFTSTIHRLFNHSSSIKSGVIHMINRILLNPSISIDIKACF